MITNDDCTKCGACCSYFFTEELIDIGRRGKGLFINNDRVDQIPVKIRRGLVVEYDLDIDFDRWLRGRKVGDRYQCKALEGQIGDCRCSIYEYRPETCRAFEPGGEKCLNARKALGFPVE
jgi:Fe-S-cluster containining protein